MWRLGLPAASHYFLLHNACPVRSALRAAGVQQGVHLRVPAPLGWSPQLVFTCRLPRRVWEEAMFSWDSLKCMSTRAAHGGWGLWARLLVRKDAGGRTDTPPHLTHTPSHRASPPPATSSHAKGLAIQARARAIYECLCTTKGSGECGEVIQWTLFSSLPPCKWPSPA